MDVLYLFRDVVDEVLMPWQSVTCRVFIIQNRSFQKGTKFWVTKNNLILWETEAEIQLIQRDRNRDSKCEALQHT